MTASSQLTRLRVATANVCTLRPDEVEACMRTGRDLTQCGRVSLLEDSFKACNIDVIGVQEARIR